MDNETNKQALMVSDLKVGYIFSSINDKYIVVDLGKHHAIAIEITRGIIEDPSWLNGPTYAVMVETFDDDDLSGYTQDDIIFRPDTELTARQALENYLAKENK